MVQRYTQMSKKYKVAFNILLQILCIFRQCRTFSYSRRYSTSAKEKYPSKLYILLALSYLCTVFITKNKQNNDKINLVEALNKP